MITVKPEKLQQDVRVYKVRQRSDQTFSFRQIFPASAGDQKQQQQRSVASPASVSSKFTEYEDADDVPVMVSATAHTSADADAEPNQLDFGYGAYDLANSGKGATLLLQPAAKAISGNGGTSISAPVSRAILRKNSGTRVIFRPDSVAIAGAGGTAHAQADLILDYVE